MRNKIPLILVIALLFNLYLGNVSFAEEASSCRYPDYAYEFTGKDSCEKFNRKLFLFNLKLNNYLLRPINIAWASIMPVYGMDRIQSAYNNSNFPVRFVSCLLQKDFKSSKKEALRFLTNTTIGVGGLYDPAKNIFKISSRDEDMGQVLAHYKVKKGPYLVLPVVRGNVRDLAGQLLNCPLRPFSYIPIAGSIVTAVSSINTSTYIQPLIKRLDETYADPYEIARQIDGVTRYIKNENIDEKDLFKEKTPVQNIIQINNTGVYSDLKPDMELIGYNPQTPAIDSMRTAFFEAQKPDKSKWSTLSVWNKTFDKAIKTSSVNVFSTRPNYNYRYILQKNKTSPVAILYPSIGEGITSDGSTVLAKLIYSQGYSVIIQGSAFQWEFVKSMPEGYKPGMPYQDAAYLRKVTAKIIDDIKVKKGYTFDKKILVGTSFGALTGLFAASQEEKENTLNISKCIAICPPVELFYSLKQLDKNCIEWKNNPSDIKTRAAVTAEKVVKIYQKIADEDIKNSPEILPFNDDEAKLVIGFIMKQKLSDVVFAVEKASRGKKCDLYDSVNNMSFYDYSQKYLFVSQNKSAEDFYNDTSLYSINDYLQTNTKYKIFHAYDDYFTNPEQLSWLKKQSGKKTLLFSNGSHLGFLYRKEFIDAFTKELQFESPAEQGKV